MAEIVDHQPHTGPVGLVTLVGLCSHATDKELAAFGAGLSRPLPGKVGVPAAKWLARQFPSGDSKTFKPDTQLLAWAREEAARRLWAIVGLEWGLEVDVVMASFDDLVALGAHPRAMGVGAVEALATAAPHQIPRYLLREHGLHVVCAEYAADAGVRGGDMEVLLPAALSATAASMAHDPLQGIAACALLIRSKGSAGIDPDRLEHAAREGTPAAALAVVLARLWRTVRKDYEDEKAPA
jgi:hypothetical protein